MPNTHAGTALHFANSSWGATAPATRACGHERTCNWLTVTGPPMQTSSAGIVDVTQHLINTTRRLRAFLERHYKSIGENESSPRRAIPLESYQNSLSDANPDRSSIIFSMTAELGKTISPHENNPRGTTVQKPPVLADVALNALRPSCCCCERCCNFRAIWGRILNSGMSNAEKRSSIQPDTINRCLPSRERCFVDGGF